MSAIVNPRDILMQATPTRLLPVTLAPNVVIPALVPDLLAPPAPTGFAVSAAISNLVISHDNAAFTIGHGYLRTHIYGAVWSGGALPVFADAVRITSFAGTVSSHPTNPATSWRLWVTWVSKDGIESGPSGGTNGLAATTGLDAAKMVAALTGPGNPFKIVSSPITLADGTVVPAGTYTADAFMASFVASRGQIGLLAVDDARIASIAVNKLTAGSLQVGSYISSSNYVAGSTGFAIWADGNAAFNNVTVRGIINASTINGSTLNSAHITSGILDIQGHNGTDWGYARSLGKWWGDGTNGWVFARNGTDGLTFAEIKTGVSRLWMSSWNDCGITFPGISMTAGGLTIDQLNVINTANLAGEAVTVPRAASLASATSANGVILSLPQSDFSQASVVLTAFANGPAGITAPSGESDPGASYPNTYAIYRNGSLLRSFPAGQVILFLDFPAGLVTYQVVAAHGAGINATGSTDSCFLSALGCKR